MSFSLVSLAIGGLGLLGLSTFIRLAPDEAIAEYTPQDIEVA